MDQRSFYSAKRSRSRLSQSALWPVLTSVLLAAGFASSPAVSDLQREDETSSRADRVSSLAGHDSRAPAALLVTASPVSVEAKPVPPTIDLASFNERFAGRADAVTVTANLSHADRAGLSLGDSDPELPGEAAGSVRARRERAVFSPISVFSADLIAARPDTEPAADPRTDVDRPLPQPRSDLLSGVPEEYAKLAVILAAEEEIDPNWVLSIMRAENARFDPTLISSAGAIGLMQVMPEIGEAYGAQDLTDPEQNIRAGARFLRVLIDKYRNPVLIASAYNAGEPRVDVHQSVPLIRETADYVTRVVGYYTGTAASSPALPAGPASRSEPNSPRRTGPADRARSPMLVFSVADPAASNDRLHRAAKASETGDPVKIVKEEVLQ